MNAFNISDYARNKEEAIALADKYSLDCQEEWGKIVFSFDDGSSLSVFNDRIVPFWG